MKKPFKEIDVFKYNKTLDNIHKKQRKNSSWLLVVTKKEYEEMKQCWGETTLKENGRKVVELPIRTTKEINGKVMNVYGTFYITLKGK